jgi:hypothetical protein
MATITTSQYFDDNARTAGEAWTINSGAELTIRTDTRWHANSPASMTGSMGNITVNDGKVIIDGTDVRWLAYDTGSGNVPAIGTSVTQAGVSASYLLGVWSSLTAAPTAVGAAMPATGFLKFREVTGAFVAGALTGIGANATGADVTGWLEVVADSSSTITVPRLGEFRTRGDWFYLDNTNGSVGQQLQVPTNNGGSGTFCPGVWIETSPGSDDYEYWPSATSASGWTRQDLGAAFGETDTRQNFVKECTGGVLQIGEASDTSATYESLSLSGTYSRPANQSCTYTWANDIVTITIAAGHGLAVGHRLYLDFTSGGATAYDGVYTIVEIIDYMTYTVALAGSGTDGNVTGYPSIIITITNHYMSVGEYVYCSFTSGTGISGNYKIMSIASTTTNFNIEYPQVPLVTNGNVTIYHKYKIKEVAHTLSLGHRVYLDYTSGSGVDGIYTVVDFPQSSGKLRAATYTWAANVVTVTFTAHGYHVGTDVYIAFTSGAGTPNGVYTITTVATNSFTVALTGSGTGGNCNIQSASFDIVANNGTTPDSGNVTVKQTIGNIPPSGCKVRIPNIFLRECATGTRASNMLNSTMTSRPEFNTTAAGKIDTEYLYTTWYHNYVQAYVIRQYYMAVVEYQTISEIATPITVYDLGVTSIGTTGVFLNFSFLQGGTITKVKGFRSAYTSSSAGSLNFLTSKNVVVSDVTAGPMTREQAVYQYSFYINSCDSCTFYNLKPYFDHINLGACTNMKFFDTDFCGQLVGYANQRQNTTCFYLLGLSSKIYIDGITFGKNGTIPNQQPQGAILQHNGTKDVILRNIGTYDNRIDPGSFRIEYVGMNRLNVVIANTDDVLKFQRIFFKDFNLFRVEIYNSNNLSSGVVAQNVIFSRRIWNSTTLNYAESACFSGFKGCVVGNYSTTGQTSVYDSAFRDVFLGLYSGRYILAFNEPTSLTDQYFTIVAGTPRFNSLGGLLMITAGDQITWEDPDFHLGHTGFANAAPVLSGATLASFTLEYDIDLGSGFSNSWTTLNGTNLSAITVDPSIGFRMKYRITTVTPGSAAMTYLGVITTTSDSAQKNNFYALDNIDLTYKGYPLGTRFQVYDLEADREIYNGVPSATTFSTSVPVTVAIDATQQVRIRAMYVDGDEAKMFYEATDNFVYTIDNVYEGITRQIDLVDDAVYNENAIDGSTVTGITIDDTNLLVNVDDPNNTISWAEIYAYESYWLTTEAGIRDEGRFIEAVDPVNYTIYGFKIKNVSDPSTPLEITGGYGVDSVTGKSITLVDNTGGTIFNSPDHIVKYKPEVTAADVWASGTRTLTAIGTSGIAAEASLITASDVWSNPTRELTGIGTSGIAAETSLIDAADVWSSVIEGSYTAQDILKILAAFSAGKTTIVPIAPAQATVTFRDINDTRDTIVATMDENERASLIINI